LKTWEIDPKNRGMSLFSSDTSAPAHPSILHAVGEANEGYAPSYGADALSQRAKEALCRVFECDLDVWLVASGTAANALALSLLCPPTGAILCHTDAHIERDERGAPEFFSGGGRLSLLPGDHGKICVNALQARLAANRPDFVHETPARALSLSNLTECGTAYTPRELAHRADLARTAALGVHLDGARFANAVVATEAAPADLSWRAGIDILSFGASKNGALACEAIILFGERRALVDELRARAKRSGHMPPKLRYSAAQMLAYLENGLWLNLARHANHMARRLALVLEQRGAELAHPVDGNEVFVRLDPSLAAKLVASGAGAYQWPDGSWRLVCSWATRPEDIDGLARSLAA
jgi:threonine aldolase